MRVLSIRKLGKYPLPVFTFLGLMAGIVAYIANSPIVAHYIWMATLIAGGAPILLKTVRGMLRGEFASDIVAMLAIVTAVLMNQAFAGAIVVLMQSGGEAIEAYGLRRASTSLDALLKRAPRFARRKNKNGLEEIDVREVHVGDTLLVRQGDLIPVDGTILQGEAEIDESAMTGEPLAHVKIKGAKVVSGTIDINGIFEMRADKRSEESQYAKIVQLVRKAQEEKAPIQRLADRYAIFFTPLTLIISLLGWLITKDPTTILSVLVVATPCPLILATPVAVISGINKAAQEGIIVKGGAPLEQIGKIQVAVFDKTGTITHGTPSIETLLPLNQTEENDLLYKAACLEQLSSHAAAQSIVHMGKRIFTTLPFPQDFREFPGRGVEGTLDQKRILIGSPLFLEERLGKDIFQGVERQLDTILGQGKLLICLTTDGILSGCIILSDQIRKNVPAMIQRLKNLGIKEVLLLTGDSAESAYCIAAQAGISTTRSKLLPEQKGTILQELMQRNFHTMMVGDGINDAPALATATVGVAMGAQGTAISAEAADIVLLVDDVMKVADAVYIGKRMLHIATQSILIGMGLSLLLMLIAAFGYITPPIGALLQEVIDASVILNALRARY